MHRAMVVFSLSILICGCAKQVVEAPVAKVEVYRPYASMPAVSTIKPASADKLISRIKELGGPKGKFETDKEFQDRVSGIGNFEICYPLFDSAIDFDSSSGLASIKSYLLDAQMSGYREKEGALISDLESFYPAINASFKSEKIGEFEGQNTYGAKATVSVRDVSNIMLVMDPISKKRVISASPFLTSEKWKPAKGQSYSMCVTAIPESPYYRYSEAYATATIQNPNTAKISNHFFRIKIAGLSVVDKDGRVVPVKVGVDPGVRSRY